MPKQANSPWWPSERAAWTPPEDLTVSEVADKYRVLSYKAEKRGPWETSYVPPARGYMDAFAVECVEEIWLVKPTQASGTEGLLNMILYAVMQDPGSAQIVEPNELLADELSKDRIDDMIRHCERLQELLSADRHETGKKKKTFQNMAVYFAWAGSPTSLASRPIRYCFFDEVDKYPPFSGKEASPLALGKERTNTFKRTRKLAYISTPTVQTGYITVGEAACEARFRYLITCPHCGAKQQLRLEGVQFGEDHTPAVVREVAWYECEKCGGEIHEDRRMELVRRGEWYDTISGLPYAECLEKVRPKTVGFQFNRLSTPWFSFGDVAAEFLLCKDDPTQLMNFRNSWMAEPWVDRAETRTEDAMIKRCNDLPARICPDNTVAVVTGCDPGQKGLWFLSLAVTRPKGFHVVDYGHMSFVGKTAADQAVELRKLVFDTRYRGLSGAVDYPIWRCGLDTGGGKDSDDETQTTRAYTMIRAATDGKRLFGTKGRSTTDAAVVTKRIVDKMPGKEGKPIPGGLLLWMVNTDSLKNSLNYYLGLPPGTHDAVTFHKDTQADLIRHILAEERQRDRLGRWSWVQIHRDNHLLDCFDPQTELLTSDGWVNVASVNESMLFATVNIEKDEIEYQNPIKIVSRYHNGEMISIRGKSIDICVTPNHRMVVYRKKCTRENGIFETHFNTKPFIVTAKELDIWHTIKVSCSKWRGIDPESVIFDEYRRKDGHLLCHKVEIKTADWFSFLGWYVSEGSRSANNSNRHITTISQKEGDGASSIAALLNRLPWKWHYDGVSFVLSSPQVYDALRGIGNGSKNKRVPGYVKFASPELISVFLESAICGDGWHYGKNKRWRAYATVSKALAGDIQELFLKIGKSANIRQVKAKPYNMRGRNGTNTVDQFHVFECHTQKRTLRDRNNQSLIKKIIYEGNVYCVSVPNGTLVCRRNGKAFIAGNCLIIALAMADRECWGGTDILKRPQCVKAHHGAVVLDIQQEAEEPQPAERPVHVPVPVQPIRPQKARRGYRIFSRGV